MAANKALKEAASGYLEFNSEIWTINILLCLSWHWQHKRMWHNRYGRIDSNVFENIGPSVNDCFWFKNSYRTLVY